MQQQQPPTKKRKLEHSQSTDSNHEYTTDTLQVTPSNVDEFLKLIDEDAGLFKIESPKIVPIDIAPQHIHFNMANLQHILTKQQEVIQHLTQQQDESWKILLTLQTPIIIVHDTKTKQVLGMNARAVEFLQKFNITECITNPALLASETSPFHVYLMFNVGYSLKFKTLGCKVYFKTHKLLLNFNFHFGGSYEYLEASVVDSGEYDDSFVMDDIVHPATTKLAIPTHNPHIAQQMYWQVSRKRDYTMLMHFYNRNNKKFVFSFEQLFQIDINKM